MPKKHKKIESKKLEIKPPSLFKRGKKQIYYVRLRTKFKDIWVSTKTSDKKEAEKRGKQIVISKFKAEAIRATEDNKQDRDRKIIDAVVKTVSGKDELSTRLDECYQKWSNSYRSYSKLSKRTKSFYASVFFKFTSWCAEKGIEHIERVDNGFAQTYSDYLWDTGIGGKTYNDHMKFLSRVFSTIDTKTPLPYRNPFNSINVERIKKIELGAEGHMALEPSMLKTVIEEAANYGEDYRDLIIIGSQTGLRLKDAALLKWKYISNNFIELIPFKTSRTKKTARIPITEMLRKILEARKIVHSKNVYVIPQIAEHYLRNEHYVTKTCKTIFENALNEGGEDVTCKNKDGVHRRRKACLYSFHSLRTTFMSLLATQDVSARDAMNILAWGSSDMIKVYEKMLDAYRGDADKRTLKIVNQIAEFKLPIPEVKVKDSKPQPTKTALEKLVGEYSNIMIGRIYNGISEAAVRKQLKKFAIKRTKRIESADVTDKEIEKIRKELLNHG